MSLYSSGHGEADKKNHSKQIGKVKYMCIKSIVIWNVLLRSEKKEWDDDDDDGNENDDDAVKGAVSFHRARQTTYLQHVW